MKNIILSFGLFSFLSVFMINTVSCGPKHEIEDSKLDSLQMSLSEAAENLNVDSDLIYARMAEITQNYEKIRSGLKDSIDLEYGNKMQKYRMIMKVYKRNMEDFEHWRTEYEELSAQVENLRHSLHNEGMTREEFKKFYYQEKADIDALVQGSKAVNTALYEMEPNYVRLSEFVDAELARMESLESKVD